MWSVDRARYDAVLSQSMSSTRKRRRPREQRFQRDSTRISAYDRCDAMGEEKKFNVPPTTKILLGGRCRGQHGEQQSSKPVAQRSPRKRERRDGGDICNRSSSRKVLPSGRRRRWVWPIIVEMRGGSGRACMRDVCTMAHYQHEDSPDPGRLIDCEVLEVFGRDDGEGIMQAGERKGKKRRRNKKRKRMKKKKKNGVVVVMKRKKS